MPCTNYCFSSVSYTRLPLKLVENLVDRKYSIIRVFSIAFVYVSIRIHVV